MAWNKQPSWITKALSGTISRWQKPHVSIRWFPNYMESSNGKNPDLRDTSNWVNDTRKLRFWEIEGSARTLDSGSEDDFDGERKELRTRLQCKVVVFVVIAFLIVLTVVAVPVVLTLLPGSAEPNVRQAASMEVRLPFQNYTPVLTNASSQEFVQFEKNFCTQVFDEAMKESRQIKDYNNCSVSSVREGSVIVVFSFYFTVTRSSTSSVLLINIINDNRSKFLLEWRVDPTKTKILSVVSARTTTIETTATTSKPANPQKPITTPASDTTNSFATTPGQAATQTRTTSTKLDTTQPHTTTQIIVTTGNPKISERAVKQTAISFQSATTREFTQTRPPFTAHTSASSKQVAVQAYQSTPEPIINQTLHGKLDSATTQAFYGISEPSTTQALHITSDPDTIQALHNTSESATIKALYRTSEPVITQIFHRTSEPATTQALHRTLEPATTQVLHRTLEPATTQALHRTLEPATTQVLYRSSEPATTQALHRTSEPATTQALQRTSEPATTQALHRISERATIQALHRTSKPAITQALHRTSQPATTQALQRTLQPATTQALHRTSQPATTQALHRTSQPATTQVLHRTSQPATTQALHRTSEPATTQALHRTSEPATTQALHRTSEPATTQALHRTPESATTQAFHRTSEPATTQALHSTSEPATTYALHRTSEPATTQAFHRTSEPVTTQALHSTSEPATTQALHRISERATIQALHRTSKPAITQALHRTSQPATTQALHRTSQLATTQALHRTSQPATTQALHRTSEPPTTQALHRTSEPATTQAFHRTSEPVTTQALHSTSEPATTYALHRTSEPPTTQALHRTSEPATAQALHRTSEPATTQALHRISEPDTTHELHRTSEPATKQSLHSASEPSTKYAFHRTSEPATTQALHKISEPATTQALQRISEPATTQALHRTSEPATTQAVHRISEPATIQALHRTSEPATTQALHRTSEPATTQAIHRTSESATTQALHRTSEPATTQAIHRTSEPATTQALYRTSEPATTQALYRLITTQTSIAISESAEIQTQVTPSWPVTEQEFRASRTIPQTAAELNKTTPILNTETTAIFTTIKTTPATTAAPTSTLVATTTETTNTALSPAWISGLENAIATVGEEFTLPCQLSGLDRLTEVRFSHDDLLLGILNVATGQQTFNKDGVLVSGERQGDVYVAELTLFNVSCNDAGTYTCEAVNGGDANRSLAEVKITRPAVKPTLLIDKYLAEGQYSENNPTCRTSSLGHNPTYAFSWVLKREAFVVEEIPGSRYENGASHSHCDNSGGQSKLDPQAYVGFNHTQLCCRLVESDNISHVVQEVCSEVILLVPGNFCKEIGFPANVSHKSVRYPFESNCYPYVDCGQENTIYFRQCPDTLPNCFNPATGNCDQRLEMNSTEPESVCTIFSPEYIPYNDTYPARCKEYQRCVNGQASPGMCPGITEFTQQPGNPCDNPSNSSYCGKRKALEPPATGSPDPTTTSSSPFVCTADNNLQYIPLNDTYPNRCSQYQWCVNGISIKQACATGTLFSEISPPCEYSYSSTTYCALRQAATATTTEGY